MKVQNLDKSEFIGKKIKIFDSKNKTFKDLEGKIVDETKETIRLKLVDDRVITIFKKEIKFALDCCEKNAIIDGKNIIKRPEDRIKG
ncbi:MAG: ribonuclease P component 1 family protein [Candidatus Woesearchaeota archaeon]